MLRRNSSVFSHRSLIIKKKTQGGHKHCEAKHLKKIDLAFSYVATYIFKSSRYSLKNYLNTTEIARDLGD